MDSIHHVCIAFADTTALICPTNADVIYKICFHSVLGYKYPLLMLSVYSDAKQHLIWNRFYSALFCWMGWNWIRLGWLHWTDGDCIGLDWTELDCIGSTE